MRRAKLALAALVPLAGCRAPDGAGEHGPGLAVELFESPAGASTATPSVAAGAGGSVHLTWIERAPDAPEGGGERATLWLASGDGRAWSAPRAVASGTDWFVNWADFPSACALADGTLIASWLRKSAPDTYAYDAMFALSRDGGASWSEPRALHDDRSPSEHGFVAFAALDARTFGTAWLDGRRTVDAQGGAEHGAGETGLYFRTIGRDGALGPEVCLDPRVCDCCPTSLVRAGPGDLAAAYRDRSAGEVRDVSFVARDASNAHGPWSAPASVHDDGWHLPGCPVNGPRLAADGERLAAVWFTGVGPGGGNVYAAFREPGGARFGAPIDVDDGLPEGRVDALFLPDGSLLVAWLEHAGDGAAWRCRRVRADRTIAPSLAIASTTAARSAGYLRMARAGVDAIAAWTDVGPPSRVRVARVRPTR